MNPSPTNRSDRPLGAAGPLVSAVVGVMTVIGLGCAAVGVLPPSLADATETTSAQTSEQATRRSSLDLRPAAKRPAAKRSDDNCHGEAGADRRGTDLGVGARCPVVDAAPRSRANSRAAQPVRVESAEVDLDVEVRPAGVAKDGSMELPGTVRRAGWYRFGATPRERSGTTVIAAHVDTRSEGLGPFARLTSVRRGDRIVVTDRGGDQHAYRVVTRRQIDRTRLPVDEVFDRDGPRRLVVLTCGGAYDARNGYRDNVVVIAEPDR